MNVSLKPNTALAWQRNAPNHMEADVYALEDAMCLRQWTDFSPIFVLYVFQHSGF